jgi:hypothetical protein
VIISQSTDSTGMSRWTAREWIWESVSCEVGEPESSDDQAGGPVFADFFAAIILTLYELLRISPRYICAFFEIVCSQTQGRCTETLMAWRLTAGACYGRPSPFPCLPRFACHLTLRVYQRYLRLFCIVLLRACNCCRAEG